MSTTDGLTGYANGIACNDRHELRVADFATLELDGALALTTGYRNHLRIDPGGASRDVTLPDATTSKGVWFELTNWADADENLVVKDEDGTVVTIAQNKRARVWCDGADWYHDGIVTVALS